MNHRYYLTAGYHQSIQQAIQQLLWRGAQERPNEFRGIISNILMNDQRLRDELLESIFVHLEWAAANNRINVNDQNQVYGLMEQHFHDFIPYGIFNTVFAQMNLDYQTRYGVEQDARNYIQNRQNMVRELSYIQNNNNSNLYQPNQANRGYQPFQAQQTPFGQQPQGGFNGNPYGSNQFAPPPGNPSLGGMGTNPYAKTGNYYDNQSSQSVPSSGIMVDSSRNKPSSSNNTPFRPSWEREEEVKKSDTLLFDDIHSLDQDYSYQEGYSSIEVASPVVESKPEHPLGSVANEGNHTGGLTQHVMNPGDVVEDVFWFDNDHSLWSYKQHQDYYAKHAPAHLYPIDEEAIEWESDYGYVIRKGVKYFVFRANPKQNLLPAVDRRFYRLVLNLDNDTFLPYFTVEEKEEYEIMEYQDHLIPGKQAPENIFATKVPVREDNGAAQFNKVVKSLEMTEEEMAEQMKLIEERGDQVESHMAVFRKVPKSSINEDTMVTDILEDINKEMPNARLVRETHYLTNDAYSNSSQYELLKEIKGCKTIAEFKSSIYDVLIRNKEYVLANRLYQLVDKAFAKILVELGITHVTVDEVIDCYDEVYEKLIVPANAESLYKRKVENMFKVMFDSAAIDLFKLNIEDNTRTTCVPRKVSIVYIKRLLSELNLSRQHGIKTNEWHTLDKEHEGELYYILRQVFVNRFRKPDEEGSDVYVITEDGALIEAITPDAIGEGIFIRIKY